MTNWQWKLPSILAVLVVLCGGMALARGASSLAASQRARLVTSPALAQKVVLASNASYQEDGEQSPFEEEEEAPVPLGPEAADDEGPPDSIPTPIDDAEPADVSCGYASCGDLELGGDRWVVAGAGCCPAAGCSGRCGRYGGLGSRGIVFGGWIEQGMTANSDHTAGRFNGPVTFNDRDGEYQCNQLWVYLEKKVDAGGYGWDVGGRVDFMYGTDARFTQSRGLELTRDLADRWSTQRFYGPALPQAYLDVALNRWTVRMGHFFTIIGCESVMAPENFFYSHAYTMQYGEPFSHTGLLASYQALQNVVLSGGFGRGWNNWEDNNDRLSFLGGLSWTSYDDATALTLALSTGNYDDAGELNRTMYSVVFSHQPDCRWKYVLQYDWGFEENGGVRRRSGGRENAEWYGINQYWLYDINESWSLGLRVEWFRDEGGTRVGGLGAPHGWPMGPDLANNRIGFAGDFCELTLGLNWKPTDRIIVRPECRWDWYNGPRDAFGRLPFDSFDAYKKHQFTFGTDLIVTF